jgi:hypothetical protein
VVIEAAANGKNSSGGNNIDTKITQDSGAIIVGAATPVDLGSIRKGSKTSASNFGKRVDCFAWGSTVYSLSVNGNTGGPTTQVNSYQGNFGGTSAATAIVAGAAILVQSIVKMHHFGTNSNGTYSPADLRNILRDSNFGTVSANPANDQIGVMPDLKKFIDIKIPPPQPVSGGNVPKPCFLMFFFRGLFKRMQWAGNRYIALKKDAFRLKP